MRANLEVGPGTLNFIEVDGVKISLLLLKMLANPNPERLYSMRRDGNNVIVLEERTR